MPMPSIDQLNMLEKAKARAGNCARIVSETRKQHDIAVAKSMIHVAKRLRAQLTRQDTALAIANAEVREIEQSLAAEGDLVTEAQNGKKK